MNMKKTLALTLSLAMLVGATTLSASAAYSNDGYTHITSDNATNTGKYGTAANSDDTTGTVIGSQDATINIQTSSSGGTTHVYAVTVSETDLTFIWSNTATTIWNPETLSYETANDAGSWQSDTQNITVNNYSDVGITVTASNTSPTSSDNGITITVGGPLNLASAYDNTVTGTMKSGDIAVSVSGTPANTYVDAMKIADFTLTITRNDG